jgi:hypothetical protein
VSGVGGAVGLRLDVDEVLQAAYRYWHVAENPPLPVAYKFTAADVSGQAVAHKVDMAERRRAAQSAACGESGGVY